MSTAYSDHDEMMKLVDEVAEACRLDGRRHRRYSPTWFVVGFVFKDRTDDQECLRIDIRRSRR